ncbi:MAG TPA: hypothetical protein VMO26_26165 [Vicinamibacterales bacterium]|nr:hypothetical protein [Vicinamibacterales bacterium]
MTQRTLFHRAAVALLLGAVAAVSTSCGDVARTGRSPVFLIVDRIEASAGGGDDFSSFLLSDVLTKGGVINDNGRVEFRLALKNPGSVTSPLGPSTLNEVTITRYRVQYIRADGRNTPGVDVPHAFDGGMTVTVGAQTGGSGAFLLVRHEAKAEPPLRNLRSLGGSSVFISTIAEITFYGRDQAGNEVMASGTISVNFADFADPE